MPEDPVTHSIRELDAPPQTRAQRVEQAFAYVATDLEEIGLSGGRYDAAIGLLVEARNALLYVARVLDDGIGRESDDGG